MRSRPLAIPLLGFLLGGYVLIGLLAPRYDWRILTILAGLSFGAPALFFFVL